MLLAGFHAFVWSYSCTDTDADLQKNTDVSLLNKFCVTYFWSLGYIKLNQRTNFFFLLIRHPREKCLYHVVYVTCGDDYQKSDGMIMT